MKFDDEVREAIRQAIDAGARPEDLRIHWRDLEWRWSPITRRWERWG